MSIRYTSASLYEEVVRVTNIYLGPAAERFISRQVENHLHKPAQEISRADLIKLIDWIRIVVSLLTEDSDIVEEYTSELQKLAHRDQRFTPKGGK